MLSRPLALGLVVAACVVAAGGGAYIATLQHARSDSAMAAAQTPGSLAAAPAPAAPSATSPGVPAPGDRQATPSRAVPPPQPSPDDPPAVTGKEAGPARTTARESGRGSRAPAAGMRPAGGSARAQDERQTVPVPPADPGVPATAAGSGAAQPVPAPIPAPTEVPPARETPRVEPEKAWQEVTVPSESVIGLQLETPLSSETARVEDRVDARVTRDVRVNGQVAIPAGTHAIGSVMLVERGGKIRDRSRLGIRFNTLVLPDSSRVPINTDTVFREGEAPSTSSSAKIGGGAIGGAIIGAILGGGKGAAIGSGIGAAGGTAAAMAGDRRPVVLPSGTPVSVRTQAPVTVTVEK